jgi:FtsZ-binding cell division protein ZapB
LSGSLEEKNKKLAETLTKLYLKMDEIDEENDRKEAELELFRGDY